MRKEALPAAYRRLAVPGAAATDHVRSASIDVLRGTAALLVALGHAALLGGPLQGGSADTLARALAAGVNLFFAVSAFLIAGPFLRALLQGSELPPIRRYALRRALRIFPAYWIALVAIVVLASSGAVVHWWQVPVHALLVHSLVPHESGAIFFVAWTLGLEALFYVLVPLAAVAIRRVAGPRPVSVHALAAGAAGLGVAAAILALTRAGSHGPPLVATLLTVATGLGAFTPGLVVYLAESPQAAGAGGWARAYRGLTARPLLAAALGLGLWVAHAAVVGNDPRRVLELPWAMWIVAGILVATVLRNGAALRPAFGVMGTLGLISYGVYLWHWVVLSALQHHHHLPFHGHGLAAWLANIALLLAITVPVALGSWLLVERPLLLRSTYWDRRGRSMEAQSADPEPEAPAPALA